MALLRSYTSHYSQFSCYSPLVVTSCPAGHLALTNALVLPRRKLLPNSKASFARGRHPRRGTEALGRAHTPSFRFLPDWLKNVSALRKVSEKQSCLVKGFAVSPHPPGVGRFLQLR